MLEREIERRMCELIKKRGGLSYKFTSPNAPGVPDRIVITPAGAVWFVELKTEVGRMANIQKWQVSLLQKQNANVVCLKGYDAVKKWVEEVMPCEP